MQKHVNLVDLVKSFPTNIFLQNLASIQKRTSPIKLNCLLIKFWLENPRKVRHRTFQLRQVRHDAGVAVGRGEVHRAVPGFIHLLVHERRASVGKISAKCCSFSAVSAPIFASKYAFYSIFQNLPDYLAEIFEIKFWQNFADFATFAKFLLNFHTKIADFSN